MVQKIYVISWSFDMESQEDVFLFANNSEEAKRKFMEFNRVQMLDNDTWDEGEKPNVDDFVIRSAKQTYYDADKLKKYIDNHYYKDEYKSHYEDAMLVEDVLRGKK